MKQFLAMALAFVAVAAASLAFDSRPAFACSVAHFDIATQADLVVLGEFVAIDGRGDQDPEKLGSPAILRLNVLKVYKGESALGNRQVEARVRLEPDSFMCPRFDSQRLLGRAAMVVLMRGGSTAEYTTDTSIVWFLGDPSGEGVTGDLEQMYFAGEAPAAPTVLPPNAGTGTSSGGDDSWNWLPVLAAALLLAPLALTVGLRRR